MSATYPFKIAAAKSAADPTRQFLIVVELNELDEYYQQFEDHGYGGTGASWREHIETIIEEYQPDLLDHLELDEAGGTFLAYADSLAAVRQFMACVLPYFGDLGKLKKYLDQTDPGDFFE
ncbi:Imm51 family immunity protein [Hymenobacter cheonanensis]|uniref:Imm51 family immunity protein n=1 Tax=Hymenobacter sp. CA2-7 TaxID=3063993 RepID=UPI0027129F42|nr:Imm51 family immunity protein [Hymenobacter sp. CA2-7]MDO7888258.1 Imm51 family immunity protein [Hymenobacter sp. CA2-7]